MEDWVSATVHNANDAQCAELAAVHGDAAVRELVGALMTVPGACKESLRADLYVLVDHLRGARLARENVRVLADAHGAKRRMPTSCDEEERKAQKRRSDRLHNLSTRR